MKPVRPASGLSVARGGLRRPLIVRPVCRSRPTSGVAPPLPQGIKRLSLNKMAAFVAEDAGQVDPINVERRVWAPSRPVIHLAAAAVMLGQRLNKRGIPTGLETFLLDRGFVEEVSRKAEKLRALIASDARFPVKAEQLVPFRLG